MENYNELMNTVEEIETIVEDTVLETINEETTKSLMTNTTKGLLIATAVAAGIIAINKFVVPKVIDILAQRKLAKEQEQYEEEISNANEIGDEE